MRHLILLILAASACGCQLLSPPPPPPQRVNVRVHSDPGKPIRGAELLFDARKVGVTDAEGLAQITLVGRYGDSFDLAVRCPKDYMSPEKPIIVTLKRLDANSTPPEYAAECPPTKRTVIVAVRAVNGPDVPVMYLGREIARTDESGAAHVMLKLPPGETFDLTLGTTEERHAALIPENPAASFVVGQRDDVFTFDQRFEVVRPVVQRVAGPPMPVKIRRPVRYRRLFF